MISRTMARPFPASGWVGFVVIVHLEWMRSYTKEKVAIGIQFFSTVLLVPLSPGAIVFSSA
jgi:hypothetical protein